MNNVPQINGILRILLGAGTPLAAYFAAHGVNAADLGDWIIAGIPLLMAIWSGFANTRARTALNASKIEGVKVVVTPDAPVSVQEVAKDKSAETKDVVMFADLPDAKPIGRRTSPR
jgi:hypothetical protein